jgi:hypothetical protein
MLTKKTDPPGSPAQLVVKPAAEVPACPDHVQAAELRDLIAGTAVIAGLTVIAGLVVCLVRAASRAAETDVGTAPRHLGRHRDRAAGTGFGHDRRFLRVVLGIEDDTAQPCQSQPSRKPF